MRTGLMIAEMAVCLLLALEDIRHRKVSVWLLFVLGTFCLARLLFKTRAEIVFSLLAAAPLGTAYLFKKIRANIPPADALFPLFMLLGIPLGACLAGLLICVATTGILLLTRRYLPKYFTVPFLGVCGIGCIIGEGVVLWL